jgi:uncharacterized protein involved in exopolysaccharide biosynthesis
MSLIRIYADRRKDDRRRVVAEVAPLQKPSEAEEVSLVDLLIVLARRRWLIAGVVAAALLLGLTAALLKPPTYTYTTSIQIAEGSGGPIESPGTVLAKLNESYIPLALQEAHAQAPGSPTVKIVAKIPKDSQIISLESFGPAEDQSSHVRLHQAVIEQLIRDQGRELDAMRLDLQSEVNRARSQIGAVEAESGLLKEKAQRLDEQEKFFKDQLGDIHKRMDQNQAMRRRLMQAGGEGNASALMLLDGELARLGQREADTNEQLFVTVNTQRDELKAKEVENTRLQADLRGRIEQLDAKLAAIAPTRAITATLRSLEPAGTRSATIVAIAVIGGVMLALFAAFLAELITRTREKLREEPA